MYKPTHEDDWLATCLRNRTDARAVTRISLGRRNEIKARTNPPGATRLHDVESRLKWGRDDRK